MTAKDVMAALAAKSSPERMVAAQWFFKTGKGQYGEGDSFIGVRVPDIRLVCKEFLALPLAQVQKLLNSPVHEHRLCGALLLASQYAKADKPGQQAIYDLYLKNIYSGRINNWDIVDTSAPQVIGRHIWHNGLPRDILFELAKSGNLWQKRTGILSSFYFFMKGDDPTTTLELCEVLINDKHDLIQKAVGWMLREIGKRVDTKLLTDFLNTHAATMPRTALRYAVERLEPSVKRAYMEAKTSARN